MKKVLQPNPLYQKDPKTAPWMYQDEVMDKVVDAMSRTLSKSQMVAVAYGLLDQAGVTNTNTVHIFDELDEAYNNLLAEEEKE
jgi:hypothetical protein